MAGQNYHNADRVSEEVYSLPPHLVNDAVVLADLGFGDLLNEDSPFAINQFFNDLNIPKDLCYQSVEPTLFDANAMLANGQNTYPDQDNRRALMNTVPMINTRNKSQNQSCTGQVPLSQYVGVGQSQNTIIQSRKISILHPLEDTFRPRYKSDYFAQNGTTRKPRYVTDALNNHFVSLMVPVGVPGFIRVDWVTLPDNFNQRHTMPYMFQKSNDDLSIPDCNPIHINIDADKSGLMKLYLVLIKSKQDALKLLQPLKPFQPYRDAFDTPNKSDVQKFVRMNPKQLIQEYKLEQSQLAFTFCSIGSDGITPVPEWDTTEYSSILTEVQAESSKRKLVSCPRCAYVIQIPTGSNIEDNNDGNDDDDDDDDNSADITYNGIQLTGSNKRRINQR